MKLVDTHAHIDFDDFEIEEVINKAKENGIEKIIIPGVTEPEFGRIIRLIEKFDGIYELYGAIGIHPSEAKSWNKDSYKNIKNLAQHDKIVAIGEIGLDYYWDKTFNKQQKEVFKQQIKIAKELDLPVIIHDREAHQDTFDILEEMEATKVVMHCFSGSPEFATQCVKRGYYIALGGVVTFKNAKTPKKVAEIVPLENLLLETDSPYLTPHPFRGKRNEPAFIKYVAQEIAMIKKIPLEELAKATTHNSHILFNI